MRRLVVVCFALVLAGAAAPALAQSARATGIVRDADGKPVKGAVIRAQNPDAYPPQVTSTTDDKGRFGMIGLRTGTWQFIVQAPGYFPISGEANVRVAATAPMQFVLERDPGLPGALARDIQQQLAAAGALRAEGRHEQALAAYQDIRAKNPRLTAVNLVVADIYRQRARTETDPAARRALLERAIASYTDLLQTAVDDERVRTELDATRLELTAVR